MSLQEGKWCLSFISCVIRICLALCVVILSMVFALHWRNTWNDITFAWTGNKMKMLSIKKELPEYWKCKRTQHMLIEFDIASLQYVYVWNTIVCSWKQNVKSTEGLLRPSFYLQQNICLTMIKLCGNSCLVP